MCNSAGINPHVFVAIGPDKNALLVREIRNIAWTHEKRETERNATGWRSGVRMATDNGSLP
jgi:hypothetical protein